MFIIYDDLTRAVVMCAPGTRSISQFPGYDVSGYSYLSEADDPAVLANPSGYFVNASNDLQLKHLLDVTTSPGSIAADGTTQSTVTIKWNDASGNRGNAAFRALSCGAMTEDINSFYFLDATYGWAVGGAGTILATVDGGLTWNPQVSGTTEDLYGIAFSVGDSGPTARGFAVGANGTILTSADGGTTWASSTSGVANDLYDCCAVERGKWRAVGDTGTVLYSTNQGSTWTPQVSGTTENLYALADTYYGKPIACGTAGTIIQFSAGAWGPLTSGTAEDLYDITMGNNWLVDQHEVIVACGSNGTILRTNDGGVVWAALTSGTVNLLQGIAMVNPQVMTAAGSYGTIQKSVDGGGTWFAQTPDDPTDTFLCVRNVALASGRRTILGEVGGCLDISDAKEAVLTLTTTSGTLSSSSITTLHGVATVVLTTDHVGTNRINACANEVYDPETAVTTAVSYITSDYGDVVGVLAPVVDPPAFTYGQTYAPYPAGSGGDGAVYGSYIYVPSPDARAISKILEFDTTTNTFTGKEFLSSDSSPFGPVAVDPTGTYLYGAGVGGLIDKFILATGAYDSSITTAFNRGPILFNRTGSKYYVANSSAGKFHVYDYATDAIVKTIGSGDHFYGGLLIGDMIYALDYATGEMCEISTITDSIARRSAALTAIRWGVGTAYDGVDTLILSTSPTEWAGPIYYSPFSLSTFSWGSEVHVADVADGASNSIVFKDGSFYIGAGFAGPYLYKVSPSGVLEFKFHSQNIAARPSPCVLFNISGSDYLYMYTLGNYWGYPRTPSIEWFRVGANMDSVALEPVNSLEGMTSSRDIEITGPTCGLIFKSAIGNRFRMTVDDEGNPVFTPI